VGSEENVVQTLNTPVGNFYKTFADEIGKFNKSKRQQQVLFIKSKYLPY